MRPPVLAKRGGRRSTDQLFCEKNGVVAKTCALDIKGVLACVLRSRLESRENENQVAIFQSAAKTQHGVWWAGATPA